MPDVLQQIDALLRHACENDNIDEARNAALALARLIRKHQLRLVLPSGSNGTSFPPPSAARHQSTSPPKPPAKTKAPDPDMAPGWHKIKSKYDGTCRWCKKSIAANSPICWSPDHGAYHPKCYLESS